MQNHSADRQQYSDTMMTVGEVSAPTELFIIEDFSSQINQTHKNATVQRGNHRYLELLNHYFQLLPNFHLS